MAKKKSIQVETHKHKEAKRRNIPTAELEGVMEENIKTPIQIAYERRNTDLDPQLIWRGKEEQDNTPFNVSAPPLYIQEKVQPKAIIEDLRCDTKARREEVEPEMVNLFNDFNGLPDVNAATEFYQHDQNWSNRMICGDSMSVMTSLSVREGLRGGVQCIYIDPPYGIRFNSNFQWSTKTRDVKDGARQHFTNEPEQVKAFRDTWSDGIHTYLSYLRDRLVVARDLLSDSGSIFVQIGDENVHRVRMVMDEVLGEDNFVNQINCRTSSGTTRTNSLKRTNDYILWYAKNKEQTKFRRLVSPRAIDTKTYTHLMFDDSTIRSMTKEEKNASVPLPPDAQAFQTLPLHSMNAGDNADREVFGKKWSIPNNSHWRFAALGFERLLKAGRVQDEKTVLRSRYFHNDYPVAEYSESWSDTGPEITKSYVVQTSTKPIERCILMTTDPGDLVLDPTCGSGTTAYVAEQWGRRWITIDTSRVALALARSRLMAARYPYYILADTQQGQEKEAEISQTSQKTSETNADIRHGFVYERVPHITLKSIANNSEIDIIWEQAQPGVNKALNDLNNALKDSSRTFRVESGARVGKTIDFSKDENERLPSGENIPHNKLLEWEVPRTASQDWPKAAKFAFEQFWKLHVRRQHDIDKSISTGADFEHLYDKPYIDNSKVRVAGPFTVESLSPHRTPAVNQEGDFIDEKKIASKDPDIAKTRDPATTEFVGTILHELERVGVQQANKEDHITLSGVTHWPGNSICAKATFQEGEGTKTAAIFIGPEFGTVSRPDLVAAANEAADARCDILITCAFNYDAHSSEFKKFGRIPVLCARMNSDLHMGMGEKLKGSGNLFVIFGEPDIEIEYIDAKTSDKQLIQVKVLGVDVFKPQTGAVISDDIDKIALWMIDTDYNQESFFVRHAYFLGANDPYKSLKTTLKAEIDKQAWDSLNSATSRPFPKPDSGRIAVKVINHLGDEVMKVFHV